MVIINKIIQFISTFLKRILKSIQNYPITKIEEFHTHITAPQTKIIIGINDADEGSIKKDLKNN